jgi:SHO1 osmosensor
LAGSLHRTNSDYYSPCVFLYDLAQYPYLIHRPGGHDQVGTLWFAIWLQAALIFGVLYTLASDSIAMHRFQISTFGAVAIFFSVDGVNRGIFDFAAGPITMGVGWLLLSFVNILWVLYFTSEEDSLALHIFNSMGTGGLTPPSRRRRTRGPSMAMSNGVGNGYSSPYSGGGGGYDPNVGAPPMSGPVVSGAGSFGPASAEARSMRSMNRPISDVSNPITGEVNVGPASPLMGSGNAGVGAGGGPSLTNVAANPDPSINSDQQQVYQAKALYACKLFIDPRALTIANNSLQTPRPSRTRTKSASQKARSSTFWTSRASGGKPGRPTDASAVRSSIMHDVTLSDRKSQLHHQITCKSSNAQGLFAFAPHGRRSRLISRHNNAICSVWFSVRLFALDLLFFFSSCVTPHAFTVLDYQKYIPDRKPDSAFEYRVRMDGDPMCAVLRSKTEPESQTSCFCLTCAVWMWFPHISLNLATIHFNIVNIDIRVASVCGD